MKAGGGKRDLRQPRNNGYMAGGGGRGERSCCHGNDLYRAVHGQRRGHLPGKVRAEKLQRAERRWLRDCLASESSNS